MTATRSSTTPPTAESSVYTLPLEIDHTVTVKAFATKYGFDDSDVITLNYTLPTVPEPFATLDSGTYDTIRFVDLFVGGSASVFYSLADTEEDEAEWHPFGAQLVIDKPCVLRAYAEKDGVVSETVTYVYSVHPKQPLALINTPTDENGRLLYRGTLADVTGLRLIYAKYAEGNVPAVILAAFYDDAGRLLTVRYTDTIITDDRQTVVVPLGDMPASIADAAAVKLYALNGIDTFSPLSDATFFAISDVSETE